MHIEGLNTPPHEHREYPKVVYQGGDPKGEARTVRELAEEEEAAADGFVPAVAPEPGTEEAFVESQEHAPVAEPAPTPAPAAAKAPKAPKAKKHG